MYNTRLLLFAAASSATIAACASPAEDRRERGVADASVEESIIVTGSGRSDKTSVPQPPPPPPPPPLMSAPPPPMPQARMAQSPQGLAGGAVAQSFPQPSPGDVDREKYEDVEINRVKLVADEPVSTFSIDVDTAAYANVRRFLNQGVAPPRDAVRIEELINYFDYDYAPPGSKTAPFSTTVQLAPSPWGPGRQLMHIGIQGYDIVRADRPPLNLTLLIDVSGSMAPDNRLPLAVRSLKLLVNELDADDRVSIAVYAGAAGAVLEPTSGADKAKLLNALDNLQAGGSTAGGEGLRLAYSLARQGFDKDKVNRVMILSDGDFNVGISDPERLEDFVARERESGVYLSVLGFGEGNYNDALMQKLAQSGNGVAAYIDTLNEARKVLNDDLSGSMFTIANDVKIQVEFNPARVSEYRLIGYETRMLNREDFNNDKVDAGDIGAGAAVTAIYELTPVGSAARLVDASRYAAAAKIAPGGQSDEFAFLKLRYKIPGEDKSRLVDRPITGADFVSDLSRAKEATRFATAVAGYGSLLRGDPYLDKSFTWDSVIDLANDARGKDEFGYRAEFVQLARLARTAASQAALKPSGAAGGQ